MTKLSGPARDGSSTRVFAPLTLEVVNDHTSQKGDGTRLTELSACTREFLAISRSMETSIDSLAGRRWSEVGEVEVVMSRTAGPARGLMSLHYYVQSSYCVSPRTLSFLPLCIRILSFYQSRRKFSFLFPLFQYLYRSTVSLFLYFLEFAPLQCSILLVYRVGIMYP